MSASADSKAPLLQVQDLCVAFRRPEGTTQAVSRVSFELKHGELLGIVGESGSGKSVTLRAIMGLLPEFADISGSIVLGGEQVIGMSADALRELRGRDVSMIFQNPASHLDPLMSIGRQVAEPLIHHNGHSRKAVRSMAIESLREVRIERPEQRADSYPHQLSGGMKQRAMIAAAVACQPRLLLADEPTTALDVTVQARILALLGQLNRDKGLSMILVSHDLAVVAQTCDRILVMKDGQLVEQGTTEAIVNHPSHAYTRKLLDSQPGRLQVKSRNPASDDTALEVSNLSVRFSLPSSGFPLFRKKEELRAVDGVSLSLACRESLGIVGESGSGKSTLVRAIMGLITPSEGDVRLGGRSILDKPRSSEPDFRHSMQMVFQNPFDSLNPRFTVREIVAEPLLKHALVPKKLIDGRVDELLRLVEMDSQLSDRRPGQLSGGQCQRVGIARALAMEPEILIADEVTSALDVTIQAQIMALLDRLREEVGLSVILISHDLELVRSFCHRVAVFKAGRIVEIGLVDDVLSNPEKEYTQALIASAPVL